MISKWSLQFADHFFRGYWEKYEFCKFSKCINVYKIQNISRIYIFGVFYDFFPDDNKHSHATNATATITVIFTVSGNFWICTWTLSKSIGFGLTKRLPPKDVRWSQLQLINLFDAPKIWNCPERKSLFRFSVLMMCLVHSKVFKGRD